MKPSDLLLAACDVLEWQGWHKGSLQPFDFKNGSGLRKKGGPVCLQGALICAITGDSRVTWLPEEKEILDLYEEARIHIENVIDTRNIPMYNDCDAKSVEEVIAVLIEAARLAAQEGN